MLKTLSWTELREVSTKQKQMNQINNEFPLIIIFPSSFSPTKQSISYPSKTGGKGMDKTKGQKKK